MKVVINDEITEIAGAINLQELLKSFALPSAKIAVELNKKVVRKKDWENVQIKDADKIEIIHFVGGG
ncbi:MAG: sulfur carrier protein ThiS [Acidobacteria bacterium]|nr:sulfur carrier protein ThiS [Acidobacteriota bacterium]MCA1637072.1 sulfur carrier protein ThiS [Acidobacteriota bacterium]